MLTAQRLVELVNTQTALTSRHGPAPRLFDALEPRALLGGDPFQVFTDSDGDICRVTLVNARPGDSLVVTNPNGGPVGIVATSTGPSSKLVIALDGTDGAPGDERPTIQNLTTTGVRTIDAPLTDLLAGGLVTANRVRSVTLGDLFGAVASLNAANPEVRERVSLTIRDGTEAEIRTPGILERLTTRRLTDVGGEPSQVIAGSIGTMLVDNAAAGSLGRFDITTSDPATEWSVKTLRVTGDMDTGTWTLGRPVQSIRVGGVSFSGGGQFQVLAQQSRIGSIIADTDLRGNWSIGSAGKVNVAEDFTGVLSTAGDVDSFRALNITNAANITARRIGQLVAGNIRNGTQILAQTVGSFLVTQSVSDSNIRVTSGPSGNGDVGTFTISGECVSSNIRILGNATAIRLGAIGNSTFYVGVSDVVPNNTLVNNSNQFIGGNSGAVGSFTINAARGDLTNFENAFVAIRQIGRLTSTARYSTFGVPFGLVFQNITTSVSFRRLGAPTITAINAGSFSDGTFRYNDLV